MIQKKNIFVTFFEALPSLIFAFLSCFEDAKCQNHSEINKSTSPYTNLVSSEFAGFELVKKISNSLVEVIVK